MPAQHELARDQPRGGDGQADEDVGGEGGPVPGDQNLIEGIVPDTLKRPPIPIDWVLPNARIDPERRRAPAKINAEIEGTHHWSQIRPEHSCEQEDGGYVGQESETHGVIVLGPTHVCTA